MISLVSCLEKRQIPSGIKRTDFQVVDELLLLGSHDVWRQREPVFLDADVGVLRGNVWNTQA